MKNIKNIKIALLDFDGTLVTKDILDLLCGIVGKEKESQEINEAFHRGELQGLSALIKRINFLSGVTQIQINETLKQNSYLMSGTKELMEFFKKNKVITILASGNILPVLNYYQELLGIEYVVGSQPQMDGESIVGIDETAFSSKSFKIDGIKSILNRFHFAKDEIIALGDSPSDKEMFEMSSFSIAVNPKGNIAEFADVVVENDLQQVVSILKKL